jgi:hypothetical protein
MSKFKFYRLFFCTVEEAGLLSRCLLTIASVVGLIYIRASAKVVHLKDVYLSDTLIRNRRYCATLGTLKMYVQRDVSYWVMIPNCYPDIISFMCIMQITPSWDMMPCQVVSRLLDPEDWTSRHSEVLLILPVDTASYPSGLQFSSTSP